MGSLRDRIPLDLALVFATILILAFHPPAFGQSASGGPSADEAAATSADEPGAEDEEEEEPPVTSAPDRKPGEGEGAFDAAELAPGQRPREPGDPPGR